MLKEILLNRYVLAGALVFALLILISVFSLDIPLGEAFLYSSILTIVGMGVTWWSYG
ncbi:MAG: hypothetical protein HND47_14200 [Chloroflexi bacterium]|nr:hypothetical protein [Chloroflexota bacterium]